MLDVSGRVALVTGASRGIGFAVADGLARQGATVVVCARKVDQSIAIALETIRSGCCHVVEGSVRDPGFVRNLVKDIHSKYKKLDIVVNNAGIMRSAMLGMTSESDIDETLAVNLAGVLRIMQGASRLMARSGGSIVNISSIVGIRGAPGQVVYAASKAGVIGATLAAAKELAPKGIRVNAVAPGYIETEMTKDLGEEVREDTLGRIGIGRLGRPEDVADVVLFLASDMARYVTGQVIGVDGGMVI